MDQKERLSDDLDPTVAVSPTRLPNEGDRTRTRVSVQATGETGPFASLELNQQVGPFLLVDFLGRGGMGQVYKALDTRLDRMIALKLLLPGPLASEERFQREARSQAKIQHEGVCQVYEVGEADGRPYIAMQLIDGRTLTEVAPELTLEEKVSVLRQVAEAVHAAHLQALVHRDLKPGNIMIQRLEEGLKAWVLDFGMVHVAGDAHLTVTGEVVSTPNYMAPEQVHADIGAIDRRTDVYSLGAILYELLTGKLPIIGRTVMEVLYRIESEDPVAPRKLRPSLPEDLEWIVLRCLEKEPSRRYRSASALIEDLDRFRRGESVDARQSTWRYRVSKKLRKHRQWVGVACLLTILLLGAVWQDYSRKREAAETARLSARFLHKVEQIEWQTRLMAALPLHDTRPEKNKLLAELRGLEQEIEDSGASAHGPGFFALGRGYHVLGELDRGLSYLEQSWEAGHRDPLLSFALGLAYGEKYDLQLLDANYAIDKEVHRQLKQDAELRYKRPALEQFHKAREGGAGESAWARALLAGYEGRWNAALEALDEAEQESPWRYEVHTERSKIWRNRADQARVDGRLEEAKALAEQADLAGAVAGRMGESDSGAYATLCEINSVRLDCGGDPRIETAEGRLSLLEPCVHAIQADSGSVDALISAAAMTEALAVELFRIGDRDAKNYFQKSVDWAQRAQDIDPLLFRAAHLQTLGFLNLSFLSSEREEQERYQARALQQAQAGLKMAPSDLEAVISLVDVVDVMAGHAASEGEDVEHLFEQAEAALDPWVRKPVPKPHMLARHALLEVKRADWYLSRGGDAEGSVRRALSSTDALESRGSTDSYSTFARVQACTTAAYLDFAKGENPKELAPCRKLVAQQVAAAPDDLEWFMTEANLSMLMLRLDKTNQQEVEPRLESALELLGESELYPPSVYGRFLGHLRWTQAMHAKGEERARLLREAITGFEGAATDAIGDLLAKIDAELDLAETERRLQHPKAAQRLVSQGRQDLAEAIRQAPDRLSIPLLEMVANRIEAALMADQPGQDETFVGVAGGLETEVSSHISWETLLKEPYMTADVRRWRTYLDGADG